jgi:inosose dehydratase
MRIATAPINWNNEDVPDHRAWVPYPDILREIRDAGYRATEWSSSLPADPDELLPDLVGHRLDVVGAFVGLELRNPRKYGSELFKALQKAAFLRSIGATYMVAADSGDAARKAAAGRVTPDLGLSDLGWSSLAAGLDELGKRVGEMGLQLVFHNHVGTYVETAEETTRLMEMTDPERVGWCLDCGHLAYGGGDTLAMLDDHGARVKYVHIKDVDGDVLARAKREGWSFDRALRSTIFAPLGQGIARIPEVVEALQRHGGVGWAVIEQDTTAGDPTETARTNRETLEELLR